MSMRSGLFLPFPSTTILDLSTYKVLLSTSILVQTYTFATLK